MPAAGSDSFYYSAHKAELERVLAESLAGSDTEAYVFRPSIVAGADAPTWSGMLTTGNRLTAALAPLRKGLERLPLVKPVLPDTGVPFQLVHNDDVAAAIAAAVAGEGEPGVYNLAAPDEITTADLARELGWATVPVPKAAISAVAAAIERAPLTPAIAEWINAFRTPVLMDSSKAARELGLGGWRSGARPCRRRSPPPASAGCFEPAIGCGSQWTSTAPPTSGSRAARVRLRAPLPRGRRPPARPHRRGRRPPVVFFHGEPTWSYLWRKVIPPVRDAGYRCIAPDYAGFGRSDKPTDFGWYSFDRHCELTATLLEDLDLRDATAVVHDWAGRSGCGWPSSTPTASPAW